MEETPTTPVRSQPAFVPHAGVKSDAESFLSDGEQEAATEEEEEEEEAEVFFTMDLLENRRSGFQTPGFASSFFFHHIPKFFAVCQKTNTHRHQISFAEVSVKHPF